MFSGVVGHSEYEAEDTPLIWRLSPELFLNDGERIPLQAGWNRQRDETALKDACERFYAATGLNSDTAFPMKYEVSAEILQEPISGSFPGLYFRTEDGEIEYVT
ncbi:MAG TPA: hypothetical protein VLA12_18070 [Planctomycetaceae bacterium]|nr:hypothetical protein [Planctomycetaceae bacterium]